MASLAELIAQHLVDSSAAVRPSSVGDWPVFVRKLPDQPNQALCIYDTGGTIDGRLMKAGTTIIHPGYQIRVRSLSNQTAFDKIKAIENLLDAIKATEVTFESVAYVIDGTHRTSGVAYLGEDDNKRHAFTSNGRATFKGA
jgi:hypothetical protein